MLVLAGAGTGKTRVVTFRIANLIKHGTRPERILAVTFTNKAAAEMQERLSGLLGKLKERPQISTFHSLCVRVLRRHARKLGYPEKFAIYDRGDQESLARGVLREIRVPSELMRPGDLLFQISRWKTGSVRPPEAAKVGHERQRTSGRDGLSPLSEGAANRRRGGFRRSAAADRRAVREARRSPASTKRRCSIICWSTNIKTPTAASIASSRLWPPSIAICASWATTISRSTAGAGPKCSTSCGSTRTGPRPRSCGWRTTTARPPRSSIANRLIAFNKVRHDKVLRAARAGGEKPRILQCNNETDEASETVADIRRRIETDHLQPRDFAILFRTNEQPRPFETELRKAKMPYVILGSQSFFDRKEVKDILAYLRTIDSPRDEVSLLRIINKPPRGIGAEDGRDAAQGSGHAAAQPIWEVMSAPGRADSPRRALARQRPRGSLCRQARPRLSSIALSRRIADKRNRSSISSAA